MYFYVVPHPHLAFFLSCYNHGTLFGDLQNLLANKAGSFVGSCYVVAR